MLNLDKMAATTNFLGVWIEYSYKYYTTSLKNSETGVFAVCQSLN